MVPSAINFASRSADRAFSTLASIPKDGMRKRTGANGAVELAFAAGSAALVTDAADADAASGAPARPSV